MALHGQGREALGHEIGIEAKARPLAGPEPDRAELLGMLVDPGALDAPPPGDLGRAQEASPSLGARRLKASGEQVSDAAGDRIDRLPVEPYESALLLGGALRCVRCGAAHAGAAAALPKGRAISSSPSAEWAASAAQCAIRARAISA